MPTEGTSSGISQRMFVQVCLSTDVCTGTCAHTADTSHAFILCIRHISLVCLCMSSRCIGCCLPQCTCKKVHACTLAQVLVPWMDHPATAVSLCISSQEIALPRPHSRLLLRRLFPHRSCANVRPKTTSSALKSSRHKLKQRCQQ